MVRFGLNETGRLAAGLLGALLLAVVVSALGAGGGFAAAAAARAIALSHLDFGQSVLTGAPAARELAAHLPATLELLAGGFCIAIVVALPLGLLLSWSRALSGAGALLQVLAAIPLFAAGLALLWIAHRSSLDVSAKTGLAFWPDLFRGDFVGALNAIAAFGLPAVVVGASGAAAVYRIVRRSARAAIREPYRESLRLMGLGTFEIDRLYLVPRLFAGLCAGLGEVALSLFAAAAVAEWVFDWPGAATLFIHSAALGDWNVAAAVLFAFAGLTLCAQFAGTLAAHALGER